MFAIRLITSVVLFPVWVFWRVKHLPEEFAWLREAWLSTLITILLLFFVAFALVVEGVRFYYPSMSDMQSFVGIAIVAWISLGLLFLLRSMAHLICAVVGDLHPQESAE